MKCASTKYFFTILCTLSFLGFFLPASGYADEAHAQHYELIRSTDAELTDFEDHNIDSTRFTLRFNEQILTFILTENVGLTKYSKRLQSSSRYLRGKLEGVENSWARFRLFNGKVNGAYFDGNELHLVEPSNQLSPYDGGELLPPSQRNPRFELRERNMRIFRPSDVSFKGTCAANDHQHDDSNFSESLSYQNLAKTLDTAAKVMSTTATSEVSIDLVVDQRFLDATSTYVEDLLDYMNFAQGIFEAQIGVALSVGQIIEYTSSASLNTNDPEVLVGQLAGLNISDAGGMRHLFTGRDLNGSTVGIAYLGQLCSRYAAGVTQRYGSLTGLIFAHELGHNFGAPHDNQSGSACSSTPSGFVMNPNINSAGNTFSACSVDQITPILSVYQGFSNSCFVPVSRPPEIISTPNLIGTVGEAYQYDEDATVDAVSNSDVVWMLDIAPDGMSISNDGVISWTPTSNDVGTVPVQISAINDDGTDTQYFEIEVTGSEEIPTIDFSTVSVKKYWGEVGNGQASVLDEGATLQLEGNIWQYLLTTVEITSNTVLEFEFKSDEIAELHGIGFLIDGTFRSEFFFNLAGSESRGIKDFAYTQLGEYQTFRIPVGQYFTRTFPRIVIASDNDAGNGLTNTIIRNLKIYNDENTAPLVVAPQIVSSPNTDAKVTEAYLYDEDNTLGVVSSSPVSFNLDIAPDGMTISETGVISWTPVSGDGGTVPVQITVSNAHGSDTQYFEIVVEDTSINFNTVPVKKYWAENGNGQASVLDEGATLQLEGNIWQYLLTTVEIAPNTVLEFEFKSDKIGELHGVGFLIDATFRGEYFFNLAGSETRGINDFTYTQLGEYQTFRIPVGQYFTRTFPRIVIASDNDANTVGVNTYIRNLKLINE